MLATNQCQNSDNVLQCGDINHEDVLTIINALVQPVSPGVDIKIGHDHSVETVGLGWPL